MDWLALLPGASPPQGPCRPSDIVYLTPDQVATAAALILVQGVVSFRLQLGLNTQLAVAAVRCVLQLMTLGYILVPIFERNNVWLVLGYGRFILA